MAIELGQRSRGEPRNQLRVGEPSTQNVEHWLLIATIEDINDGWAAY